MGHLDRLEEGTLPSADDVGCRAGLRSLRGCRARLLTVADPPLGLAPDDHGDVSGTREDGGQGIVDQTLLGDTELHQVRLGSSGAHPLCHQAGWIHIGPTPLRNGHPVDGARQSLTPGIGQCRLGGLDHELDRLRVITYRPHPHQDGCARVEGVRHRATQLAASGEAADSAAWVLHTRSIRPSWRHVTSTAPWAKASGRARSGMS